MAVIDVGKTPNVELKIAVMSGQYLLMALHYIDQEPE